MDELEKYLRALLLLDIWNTLQTAERSGVTGPKLDVILADSGFSHKEIGDLLCKSPVAVAKAVSRGRAARKAGSSNAIEPEAAGGLSNDIE